MDIIGINNIIPGLGGNTPRTPVPSSTSARSVTKESTGSDGARVTDQAKLPGNAGQTAESLEQSVRDSVEKLNEFIRPYVTSLQFSVDKDSGKVVVKIMDSETQELIKQIPSEEVLAITKALSKVSGLFVQQQA